MTVKSLQHGLYGSLAGGVIFGVMMGMMGMLPTIGAMAGSESPVVGFLVHLIISAMIGVGFVAAATMLGREQTAGVGAGLAYGVVWWILGPLTLMPLFMGMGFGVNWSVSGVGSHAEPRRSPGFRGRPGRDLSFAADKGRVGGGPQPSGEPRIGATPTLRRDRDQYRPGLDPA